MTHKRGMGWEEHKDGVLAGQEDSADLLGVMALLGGTIAYVYKHKSESLSSLTRRQGELNFLHSVTAVARLHF